VPGRPPADFLIGLADVSFAYAAADGGVREVLRGVSVGFRRGERTLLSAPTGSGKTTVLRLLLGLCRPAPGGHLGPRPLARSQATDA
jgi:energy-coupling factor transporter ATP-binding protein EcfA2